MRQIKVLLISVLIPVKNPGIYLKSCLDSILNQSYQNFEIIAVDDSSTDGSAETLFEYSNAYSNFSTYRNQGSGITNALQTAYNHSKGDYVHRMDADDIMPTNKLKALLDQWKKGCVVTGKVKYFSDEWLVGLGFKNYESWINNLMDSKSFWEDVYMECPIPSPAWLMERKDFESIGGFDSAFLPEDYDLCFRVYKAKMDVVCVKEVVHLWRDSQNRTSRKLPIYFPMAYYPLKVKYFMEIDRDKKKPLLLWGAGKKGKRIANLLLENKQDFVWCTDNNKKIGVDIYNKNLKDCKTLVLNDYQIILAVSSPQDKREINKVLANSSLKKSKNYWWFC